MLDDEQIEKIRQLCMKEGRWIHAQELLMAEDRIDGTNTTDEEDKLLSRWGYKGFELVQIVPEWHANKVHRYTYYFKKWFPYDDLHPHPEDLQN